MLLQKDQYQIAAEPFSIYTIPVIQQSTKNLYQIPECTAGQDTAYRHQLPKEWWCAGNLTFVRSFFAFW